MPWILIVDDEPETVQGLKDDLRSEGYMTIIASNGEDALRLALQGTPELILLDVMMPQMSGWDVLRALRQKGVHIPVILLTARGEEVDRALGLELGVDDYVTKPFSLGEPLARVRAVLRRRVARQRGETIAFAEVRFRLRGPRTVKVGRPTRLTRKEHDLLRVLMEHRGEVITRHRILVEVWGDGPFPSTRTVDTHILNLRQKLEEDPERPVLIVTAQGLGYKFAG